MLTQDNAIGFSLVQQLLRSRSSLQVSHILFVLLPTFCGCCDGLNVTEEVWFEIETIDTCNGTTLKGRFTVALFGEIAPLTVMNFVAITKGYKSNEHLLHYKGNNVHRIVQDFCIQMGDVTKGDGTGGRSIYGETFADESFVLQHRSAGWVAMANHGKDSNGSQFYVLFTRARWLDKKHVVFGKVINGFDFLLALGDVRVSDHYVPDNGVTITDCGVVGLKEIYEFPPTAMDKPDDLVR